MELLYDYECSLNTLTFPSGKSIPTDAPSLYCKTAPPYATTKTSKGIFPVAQHMIFIVCFSVVLILSRERGCVCVCVCVCVPNVVLSLYTAQLDPLILVELMFVIATSASQANAIVSAVNDLIQKHLVPEKSNVK